MGLSRQYDLAVSGSRFLHCGLLGPFVGGGLWRRGVLGGCRGPRSVLAKVGRQNLHDRTVIFLRVAGDALQRKDAANPNVRSRAGWWQTS
jgi:hypothetical protein